MTLKDRLLETLNRERKAIDAAIFLIESSDTLDAIEIEGVAPVESSRTPVPAALKRRGRPRATPPLSEADADDDLDIDPDEDEDIPNPFQREPPKPRGRSAAASIQVRCDTCDERFPNAQAMGIHKTRVHFGRS